MNMHTKQHTEQRRLPLRIADDDVSGVRPSSYALVAIPCYEPCTAYGVAQLHTSLFHDHGCAIARGLMHLSGSRGNFLLTHFASEREHISKGTAVALFEGIEDAERCFMLQTGEAATAKANFAIKVNNNLS